VCLSQPGNNRVGGVGQDKPLPACVVLPAPRASQIGHTSSSFRKLTNVVIPSPCLKLLVFRHLPCVDVGVTVGSGAAVGVDVDVGVDALVGESCGVGVGVCVDAGDAVGSVCG
jgi:hypothetical protein